MVDSLAGEVAKQYYTAGTIVADTLPLHSSGYSGIQACIFRFVVAMVVGHVLKKRHMTKCLSAHMTIYRASVLHNSDWQQ